MSNQPEPERQATLTPEEARQLLLAEIEATQQVIAGLSEEQLQQITGGCHRCAHAAAWQKRADQHLWIADGLSDKKGSRSEIIHHREFAQFADWQAQHFRELAARIHERETVAAFKELPFHPH